MYVITLSVTGLVLYLAQRFFFRAIKGKDVEGISFPPDIFERLLARKVYNKFFGLFYAFLLFIAGIYSLYNILKDMFDF